jgi:lipopolysaccharide export system protein LptA
VIRRAAALALLVSLSALARAAEPPVTPPAAPPAGTEPAPPPPTTSSEAAERLGLKFTRNAELVITSDEATGVKNAIGRQTVVFVKHVIANQGDMHLESDWLEAIYPPTNAGHPDKITAKGSVVITQETNTAHCAWAEIDNVLCTAECHSEGEQAKLRRGTDDVIADTIYFDLCKNTVKAVGNVSVRVKQEPETPAAAPGAAPGTPPVATPGASSTPAPAPTPAPAAPTGEPPKANGG